jgi:4-amino-4-deoxy-L-arabinose transferase-like glycosyltransferase
MAQPRRLLIFVIIAAAALYLVGNDTVGLWDRDEPRYAQTSKQMLQRDPPDWVVPRLLDKVRTAKPIFIYWTQAAAMWATGSTGEFAARLPSAVAMLITLTILGIAVGRAIGWRRALWTVFILSTAGLVIAAAKMCITDSVLLLWITIAQLALFAIYQGNRSWSVTLILWIAIGLAILTKGPVVLGVQITTIIVLAALDVGKQWKTGVAWKNAIRWWWQTRPLIGILITVAVAGPWVYLLHQREPTFIPTALKHDVLARSAKPLEGHSGPPGYYLLTIWATFFPWSVMLPAAIPWAIRNRRLAPLRFSLAAIIGPWILWELIKTKLAHYVLPTFPFLAFITADMLVRAIRGQIPDLRRTATVVVMGIWAVIVLGLAFVPWLASRQFDFPRVGATLFSIVGVVYALVVFILWARRRVAAASAAMGVGMIAVISILYAFYLPNAQFLWMPQRISAVLHEYGATTPGDVIMLDYDEDSLPYYQGGTIRARRHDYFTTEPEQNWVRWVIMTDQLWAKLPENVKARYETISTIRGLNYAKRSTIQNVMILRRR